MGFTCCSRIQPASVSARIVQQTLDHTQVALRTAQHRHRHPADVQPALRTFVQDRPLLATIPTIGIDKDVHQRRARFPFLNHGRLTETVPDRARNPRGFRPDLTLRNTPPKIRLRRRRLSRQRRETVQATVFLAQVQGRIALGIEMERAVRCVDFAAHQKTLPRGRDQRFPAIGRPHQPEPQFTADPPGGRSRPGPARAAGRSPTVRAGAPGERASPALPVLTVPPPPPRARQRSCSAPAPAAQWRTVLTGKKVGSSRVPHDVMKAAPIYQTIRMNVPNSGPWRGRDPRPVRPLDQPCADPSVSRAGIQPKPADDRQPDRAGHRQPKVHHRRWTTHTPAGGPHNPPPPRAWWAAPCCARAPADREGLIGHRRPLRRHGKPRRHHPARGSSWVPTSRSGDTPSSEIRPADCSAFKIRSPAVGLSPRTRPRATRDDLA